MSFAPLRRLYVKSAKGGHVAGRETPAAATLRVLHAGPDVDTVVVAVSGRIRSADIPALCERARVVLQASDAEVVVCDVGAVTDPDTVTIDALARLALTVRRLGRSVRLRNACERLRDLLTFVGLCEAVGLDADPGADPSAHAP